MDSDLAGDLSNSNILLPTIIYSGVPAGYDCLVLSDLVRSSGSAIFVLKDDKRIATTIAGIALYNVASIAALGANAIAGNNASPSFDIAFPSSADRGI